jgi:hypothetical protein
MFETVDFRYAGHFSKGPISGAISPQFLLRIRFAMTDSPKVSLESHCYNRQDVLERGEEWMSKMDEERWREI